MYLKKVKVLVTQSCATLCDPMDCSLPVSSVHGILQARVLEWVAISFSRGYSQPRDWTWSPALRSRFLTTGPLGKALQCDLELFIDWFCWSRQQTFEKHWSMVFNFNFTLESLQLKERDCQREREATLGTHFRPKSLGWSWNICAFYKLPRWYSCAARVENYESRSTSSLSVLRDVTCARLHLI